jgi:uncharacterized membrane protein YgdD (TMEM256/DUF423 family)
MARLWIVLGSVSGLIAVAMAAALSHALPGRLDETSLQWVRTAQQIQAWHAVMLVLCGVLASRVGLFGHLAGAAFTLGTLLFCGAVYTLGIEGFLIPGAAPVGGSTLMLGWLLVAFAGLRWKA